MNTKFEMFKFYFENSSLSSKILASRVVEPGEVVRYDKDRDVTAITVGEEGEIKRVSEGRYVYPEERSLTVHSDDYPSGINGLNSALGTMLNQEDQPILDIFLKSKNSYIVENNFKDLFKSIESAIRFGRLSSIITSRETASEIMYQLETEDNEKSRKDKRISKLDLAFQKFGFWGTYKKVDILSLSEYHPENAIPDNTFIGVPSSAYLGGMPIRVDLMEEPFEETIEGSFRKGEFYFKLQSQIIMSEDHFVLGKLG